MKYYWLRYTDNMDENFAGITRAFVISIRPKYKDDKGLLEHEKTHVRQWYKTLGLHGLLYAFWRTYRLNCELEAYKEQMQYAPDLKVAVDKFADFLANKYGLDITIDRAVYLLRG